MENRTAMQQLIDKLEAQIKITKPEFKEGLVIAQLFAEEFIEANKQDIIDAVNNTLDAQRDFFQYDNFPPPMNGQDYYNETHKK